jgi:hypothetical protein
VNPQSVNVDYQRGWFLWPSIVYVRKLQIRGSDANVQWQVEIDEARVAVDLTALFKREFHATQVRAKGVGFRLRQKIDGHAATSERVAPLPPIPGIEGPPVREDGPPEPDIREDRYKLWTVRIENVDALARQIWVDEFHFEGVVHVTGAFFLRPKRWLWVGPAKASIASGSVIVGKETLLDSISGEANCTVPPFDPRPPNGMEFFRFISGAFQLDSHIPSTRALDYYTRIRGNSTVFDAGAGPLHVDGSLRSGVARPLNLAIALSEIRATKYGWLALGSLNAAATTGPEGPSTWLVRVAQFELRQTGEKYATIQGKELRVTASSDAIDASKPMPPFEVQVDLSAAQIPNLQLINKFMSSTSQLHIDGGWASIAAHFDANTGRNRANGVVAVSANSISGHVGPLHFKGQIQGKAHVAQVILDSGDTDLSGAEIEVRDVTLRDSNASVSNWWSNVELHRSKFRPSQRLPVDVIWTAQLKNATPVLAFSKRIPSVPSWITRFLAGGKVEASGRLQAGTDFVELSNLRARTGLLEVTGHLREKGDAKSGVFRVSAFPFSVGIELKNEETKVILMGSAVEPQLETPSERVTLAH